MERNIWIIFERSHADTERVQLSKSQCMSSPVLAGIIKNVSITTVRVQTAASKEVCTTVIDIMNGVLVVEDVTDVLGVLDLATTLELVPVCQALLARVDPSDLPSLTEVVIDEEVSFLY